MPFGRSLRDRGALLATALLLIAALAGFAWVKSRPTTLTGPTQLSPAPLVLSPGRGLPTRGLPAHGSYIRVTAKFGTSYRANFEGSDATIRGPKGEAVRLWGRLHFSDGGVYLVRQNEMNFASSAPDARIVLTEANIARLDRQVGESDGYLMAEVSGRGSDRDRRLVRLELWTEEPVAVEAITWSTAAPACFLCL